MSAVPLPTAQWAPYPNSVQINAELTHAPAIACSLGDLLYWDATNHVLKPLSQFHDTGAIATTLSGVAAVFCGISNSQQLATDANAEMCRVITDCIVDFPCVSGTFNPGDYVTPVYTTSGAGNPGCLGDQVVVGTGTTSTSAIGRVVRYYPTATTIVKVRIRGLFLIF